MIFKSCISALCMLTGQLDSLSKPVDPNMLIKERIILELVIVINSKRVANVIHFIGNLYIYILARILEQILYQIFYEDWNYQRAQNSARS